MYLYNLLTDKLIAIETIEINGAIGVMQMLHIICSCCVSQFSHPFAIKKSYVSFASVPQ